MNFDHSIKGCLFYGGVFAALAVWTGEKIGGYTRGSRLSTISR